MSLLAIIIVDQRHGSLYTTDEKYNTKLHSAGNTPTKEAVAVKN